MQLKKLRDEIDKLDKRLLELLNQRAKEVVKVSSLKKKKRVSTYSPEREAKILAHLKKCNKGPLSSQDLEAIYGEILSVCRSLRTTLKVGYLGPKGTFTHLAATKKFGKKPEYIAADSISDVFERVDRQEVDYGVVPIENSIEGVVNYTLDMFLESNLKVCAEITLNISHSLLSKTSLDKIKRIYSNPQVFAQCRHWILTNLAGVELIESSSTAKAAQQAKKDAYGACIGNKILTGIYGLRIIRSSIEDAPHNYTRFLVISKNDGGHSGNDKTSILFAVKDRVGALHDVLASFKKHKINLTKIESRPSKKKAWEYYFFVDFNGHRASANIEKVLKRLEKDCSFVKVLGSYPKEG